jgi:hypothetical protein
MQTSIKRWQNQRKAAAQKWQNALSAKRLLGKIFRPLTPIRPLFSNRCFCFWEVEGLREKTMLWFDEE